MTSVARNEELNHKLEFGKNVNKLEQRENTGGHINST